MAYLARRFPGGLFPRLVALFPLFFPLHLIQGVLLGVPVNLPEVFLMAIGLYFLFEHDSFRWGAWKLWSVLLFILAGVFFVFFAPFPLFIALKSWIFFPLLFFIVSRNVFREKASMIFLSERVLMALSGVLALFLLNQGNEALGTVPTLSLFIAPGLVLSGLFSAYADSKTNFGVFFSLLLLCSGALFSVGAFLPMWAAFLVLLLHGVFYLRKGHALAFYASILGFIASLLGSIFFLFQEEVLVFEGPDVLLESLPMQIFGGILGLAVAWMSVKAFLWLSESDGARRGFMAWAYLCFLLTLGLHLSVLTIGHVFLFWLFMAVLL